MVKREKWKSRSVFIMAAVGSAIGLGNIWRFPYVAAQNGGGAFLVPYFIALLTAGIPIMIIEYGLGIRSQGSANIALGSIRPVFRYFGWVAIMGAFVINIYYCVVMGWVWCYLFDIPSVAEWARNIASSQSHFMADFLGKSDSPFLFGGIQWKIFGGLAATWLVIWVIIKGGLGRIGKALLYTVPLPVVLILILVVRGIMLPGSTTGLNYYLAPDWVKLLEPGVWLAAYGQIFFSLSIGFGTMIVYSSFMPRDTEIPNSAAITSFTNCAFSFLTGFAVFSVLGYFAVASNLPMKDIINSGPGLAFVVYPAALAKLPFWVEGFAMLFFLTLLLLGINSAFSLLETVGTALSDKFNMSRTKSTTLVALISFLLGIPFVTKAGLMWLDIVDHYIMFYLITFTGLIECVIVGYVLGAKRFTDEINRYAEIKLGILFSVMIRFVTPVILIGIIISSIYKEFQKSYGVYSTESLILIGGGALFIAFVSALLFGAFQPKNDGERKAIEQLNMKENTGE